MMRKRSTVAIAGSLMLMALWIGMPTAQETAGGPAIVLEETEFRFGEVMEGETVEHAFRVQNRGDEPLEILSVKPG